MHRPLIRGGEKAEVGGKERRGKGLGFDSGIYDADGFAWAVEKNRGKLRLEKAAVDGIASNDIWGDRAPNRLCWQV